MTITLDPTIPAMEAATARHEHAGLPAVPAPRFPRHRPAAGRHLLIQDGVEIETVPLTAEVTHLGRGLTADVRLDDHLVSRRHAMIVLDGGRARLIDDRSANGTVLNGQVVGQAELNHGDVIVLGRSVLRYLQY